MTKKTTHILKPWPLNMKQSFVKTADYMKQSENPRVIKTMKITEVGKEPPKVPPTPPHMLISKLPLALKEQILFGEFENLVIKQLQKELELRNEEINRLQVELTQLKNKLPKTGQPQLNLKTTRSKLDKNPLQTCEKHPVQDKGVNTDDIVAKDHQITNTNSQTLQTEASKMQQTEEKEIECEIIKPEDITKDTINDKHVTKLIELLEKSGQKLVPTKTILTQNAFSQTDSQSVNNTKPVAIDVTKSNRLLPNTKINKVQSKLNTANVKDGNGKGVSHNIDSSNFVDDSDEKINDMAETVSVLIRNLLMSLVHCYQSHRICCHLNRHHP